VRRGGNWKRDYGTSYTGTQGETPDTAKELPTDCRASSRPYQVRTARYRPQPVRQVMIHRRSRPAWLRWRERQRSMGPVPVAVIDEHVKDPLEVLLVQNQQPVETL
jgi:hypothetical protein